ncbi:TetR/AcrR family transcriptional regulator [Compostimonas suwonensis]|uniref:AcrR family transcriptional regulator n=1 Tax=Compostimonas suwonensis TaxID=1048394 RepID=A0A2M9C3M0_9MICO|nr:TetR/AcrR family transcriptional regulator [Compostimonas suwonensis]PJJ65079.1 AcrR family transcriptional regulator [Compostimonas suwonensis]
MSSPENKPGSREAIRSNAQRLFAERGYAGTPLRDIARDAGVDPAMIIRHFTSKQQLFLETMQLDLDHDVLLTAPIDTLGEAFIDYQLRAGTAVRDVFLALIRASDSEDVASRLREAHEEFFVGPLRQRLSGDDAELRARLAAALVGGMLYSLWVVGDDQLAAADHRELVRRYGRLLQELITPSEA